MAGRSSETAGKIWHDDRGHGEPDEQGVDVEGDVDDFSDPRVPGEEISASSQYPTIVVRIIGDVTRDALSQCLTPEAIRRIRAVVGAADSARIRIVIGSNVGSREKASLWRQVTNNLRQRMEEVVGRLCDPSCDDPDIAALRQELQGNDSSTGKEMSSERDESSMWRMQPTLRNTRRPPGSKTFRSRMTARSGR